MEPALARLGKEELRRQVLAGGYRVTKDEGRISSGEAALNLVTTGAMVPECLQAAAYLEDEGVSVNLVHLTSPRRAFENREHVASLVPSEWRNAPILTVHDAASHALAWVGGVFGQRTRSLGVNKFGQSGYREDVYRYVHIDVESIVAAGFGLVDE
jgi:pyruvate dehydrogenase E1 component